MSTIGQALGLFAMTKGKRPHGRNSYFYMVKVCVCVFTDSIFLFISERHSARVMILLGERSISLHKEIS